MTQPTEAQLQKLLRGDLGGFACRLAEAYTVADSINRNKLVEAWPKVFTEPRRHRVAQLHIGLDMPLGSPLESLSESGLYDLIHEAVLKALEERVMTDVNVLITD